MWRPFLRKAKRCSCNQGSESHIEEKPPHLLPAIVFEFAMDLINFWQTAFCIPDHHYQWTVMPFGLGLDFWVWIIFPASFKCKSVFKVWSNWLSKMQKGFSMVGPYQGSQNSWGKILGWRIVKKKNLVKTLFFPA